MTSILLMATWDLKKKKSRMRGRKGEQEEERVKIKLDRQDWFPQLGIQSCHLLDNWPCRGTEGRGQVPGVHLPQQKSGLGLPGR